MTGLPLGQLAYLARKARLPEKLVLNAGRETVTRFQEVWQGGRGIESVSPKVISAINELYGQIPLISECSKEALGADCRH